MMGGCGSLCDCLQRRGKEQPASEEGPPGGVRQEAALDGNRLDNPFRPTKPRSSKEIYHILGPHPNGVKY